MNEIKKINVDGVDYDIVSESAEKKIAELEKNNTALASVIIGTTSTGAPIEVKLGADPDPIHDDIYIGKKVYLGPEVIIGTKYPVHIGWQDDGSLTITSNGGNRGGITIGSNVNIQIGSGSGSGSGNAVIKGEVQINSGSRLRMSSAIVDIEYSRLTLNSEGLRFGTQGGWIGKNISIAMYGDALELRNDRGKLCQLFANESELYIGSALSDTNTSLKVCDQGLPVLEIGAGVTIGENLKGEHLTIKGPVYLEAASGGTHLTIGTDEHGGLKIDWSDDGSAITFTHAQTGKKATLTLS